MAGGILARKLGNFVELSGPEREALNDLGRQQRHHGAREHLSLENLERMVQFYARLIATAAR